MSWLTQAGQRVRAGRAVAEHPGGSGVGTTESLTTESLASGLPAESPHAAPGRVLMVDTAPTLDEGIPHGVRLAAAWAWRIILFVVAVYLLMRLIGTLRVVVIPVVVALLLAALFEPVAGALRRVGVHRSLASALVLVGGLVVVIGGLGVIISTFVAQIDVLSAQVVKALAQIRSWFTAGPLHLSQAELNNVLDKAQQQLVMNQETLTSRALSTAGTVTELVTGFFIVLFTLFFFLRDGQQIWRFLCDLLPRAARGPMTEAGHSSWRTLVSYVRATVLVAFVDAVGIGVGIAVLKVPLALPLAALVFLASFVPVIGATVSGTVAILVALVANGPITALIVLGIVIAVQQLEGHVLQPLIMGRAVALHPLAVILTITTGVVTAGIVGGLVAVPLLAVLNTGIRYLAAHPTGEPAPGDVPPGTDPAIGPADAAEDAAESADDQTDAGAEDSESDRRGASPLG
ncbi:MAG: hypothetical protein QG622_683 [Actinomycetota bacterium]|nr:hypothetical protein [Actinomycetota bacterium]